MKETQVSGIHILIVGYRRPWNVRLRLAAWQWRMALVVVGVVAPLMLALMSYRIIADMAPLVGPPGAQSAHIGSRQGSLHQEVVALSTSTEVGLNALNGEIGVLSTDVARLSVLRDRLAQAAGLTPTAFMIHAPSAPYSAVMTHHAYSSQAMTSLRRLAWELRPPAAGLRHRGL
ncbi:MAG: hypothetical protein ACYCXG_02390 [Acidiferrobacter sp.]